MPAAGLNRRIPSASMAACSFWANKARDSVPGTLRAAATRSLMNRSRERPFSTQVSFPGVETGGVTVSSSSRFMGTDINGLFNLYRSSNWSLNVLGGFRYFELDESVTIVGNSYLFQDTVYTDNFGNVLADAPPGSSVQTIDQFNTRNSFYGGQLGAQFRYNLNRWSFGAITKLAIGDTHEVITINGTTNVFPINNYPVTLGGGNYATIQSGRYSSDHFAVAPEVTLNVGYQFTPFARHDRLQFHLPLERSQTRKPDRQYLRWSKPSGRTNGKFLILGTGNQLQLAVELLARLRLIFEA